MNGLVPCRTSLAPLASPCFVLCLRGVEKEGLLYTRGGRGSCPLCSGTFAQSYSVWSSGPFDRSRMWFFASQLLDPHCLPPASMPLLRFLAQIGRRFRKEEIMKRIFDYATERGIEVNSQRKSKCDQHGYQEVTKNPSYRSERYGSAVFRVADSVLHGRCSVGRGCAYSWSDVRVCGQCFGG